MTLKLSEDSQDTQTQDLLTYYLCLYFYVDYSNFKHESKFQ